MKRSFAVGNVDTVKGFVPRGAALDLDLFDFDSLTFDILVGCDTLQELHLLNHHSDSFIDSLTASSSATLGPLKALLSRLRS